MKTIKKILILISLCLLIIIPQTGCSKKEPVSREMFCLDTICTVTVYGGSKKNAEKIIDEAFELCSYYENLLSKTVESSDVYRINTAAGHPVEVSEETIDVIKKGIRFGEISGGKFDITIGAVSALWDFKSETPQIPDDDDIQEAVKTVDYTKIRIDGSKVTLLNEGAQLDLGGIAKGYIADKMTEQMLNSGVESAIINLGGNIVAIGEKEDGSDWKIGIEKPYSDRSEIVGAVEVKNATVTTSGVYERFFEADGKIYHHILDPDTGYPAENCAEAVTVEGKVGMSAESDALGTVFLMMDYEQCREILREYPEMKAAFVDADDEIYPINGMEISLVE